MRQLKGQRQQGIKATRQGVNKQGVRRRQGNVSNPGVNKRQGKAGRVRVSANPLQKKVTG